jgi:CRISPR-associated endonuclease Csn1
MNDILNPHDSRKTRDDHRHHAIDAAVVALSTPSIVKRLSDCAAQAISVGRRRLGILPPPWPNFFLQMSDAISATNVSLRPENKLNARMHEETGYSAPKSASASGPIAHTRKGWNAKFDLDNIVDFRVREIAKAKLESLGGNFALLASNPPVMTHPSGASYPIRRVRVAERKKPIQIGNGPYPRYFLTDGIHHTAIVRDETKKEVRFLHLPVTVVEALERHRNKKPIIQKDFDERQHLVCTLRSGDILHIPHGEDRQCTLWRVRSVRQSGQMHLTPLSDSRDKKSIMESKAHVQPSVNAAFRQGARKVHVTLLGEIIPAND